jgi:hypothetical protein
MIRHLASLLSLIIFLVQITPAKADSLDVGLLTCGQGNEIFEAFGHSAFRVVNHTKGTDKVYNYGVFDFSADNFYINFIQGNLYYELGVEDFERFMYSYRYFNRSVEEQQLSLSNWQKEKLVQYLDSNAQPENKYYNYNYFRNNCSSQLRDVLINVLGTALKEGTLKDEKETFRTLIKRYTAYNLWGRFGINLGLGRPIDHRLAPVQYVFLPDYLSQWADIASIKSGEGSLTPLVSGRTEHFKPTENTLANLPITPWNVTGGLFLIGIALGVAYSVNTKSKFHWFDRAWLLSTGITGTLLVYIWFFTQHSDAANNFNVMWAFPLNLVVAFLPFRLKPLVVYWYGIMALSGLFLLLVAISPQAYEPAFIPICFMIVYRSYLQTVQLKKRTQSRRRG